MKNFKQIAFGLLVGAMAIGFSAFTSGSKTINVRPHKAVKNGMITSSFILQSGGLNDFQQDNSYSSGNCGGTATRLCGYSVTTTGQANIPDQADYTGAEIDNYVSHSWLTPAPSSKVGLYN